MAKRKKAAEPEPQPVNELEVNYGYSPPETSPVVAELLDDAEASHEAFVAVQERNVADGDALNAKMARGGVPESKRPI